MKVDQSIDQVQRLVTLTLSGELSDDGLLGLADLVERNPSVSKDFSLLLDMRAADGSKVTTEGVRWMAARSLVLAPDARRAIVVPTLLGFGMARMYALRRGEGPTRVFVDYDKARRWLETGSDGE